MKKKPTFKAKIISAIQDNRKAILLPIIMLIMLTAIFVACNKTDIVTTDKTINERSIQDLKDWFINDFMKSSEYGTVTHTDDFINTFTINKGKENAYNKFPIWSNASVKKYTDGELIEVPINYQNKSILIPIINGETESELTKIKEQTKSIGLFTKNKNKSYSKKIITIVPSFKYLQNNNFNIKELKFTNLARLNFEGYIYIKEWNEKTLEIRKYIADKKVQILTISKDENNGLRSTNCNLVQSIHCQVYGCVRFDDDNAPCGTYATDWSCSAQNNYQCLQSEVTAVDCQTLGCFCQSLDMGCTIIGGGAILPPALENAAELNLDGQSLICKSSFKYKKYISSPGGIGGWQGAVTVGIHMNIVETTTGLALPLALPPIYFGLPVLRADGTFYSTQEAARITALAVEKAELDVMNRYHSLGGSLDVAGMSLYYRQRIDHRMSESAGSASLTPALGITYAEVGYASYPWPIIDCGF